MPAPLAALLLAATTSSLAPAGWTPISVEESVRELLRGRTEALTSGLEARAAGRRLLARNALPSFYADRAFEPAWLGESGGALIDQLRRALENAQEHGLDPTDYHAIALDSLVLRLRANQATQVDSVDIELLASDAFLVYGSHLLLGRVNPESVNPEWVANRRSRELQRVLAEAVATREIGSSLSAMAPQQPRYASLQRALARLREVERGGGWGTTSAGATLEAGSTGTRVSELQTRLRASGDLAPAGETGTFASDTVFGSDTEAAVRRFQARHGLDVDGRVGPATLEVLNVPAGVRARQIETNLERWRWLPEDLGHRHVEVNIAAFAVDVVQAGTVVRRHRAVVGRQYRETPMFSGQMTYLVLAPYWHVPPTIAAVDKLPAIRRDPGMIAAQRMTLLDQRTNAAVDPATVDWTSITGSEFNRQYRLRQDPGPHNALGAVKFMFPNRHNVYLHDTPSRELFDRTVRSFSSGCIRVEDPLGLAEYLLADQGGWPRSRIDAAAAGSAETTVRLTTPVPVHLLYWTAWADEQGTVHFRQDLYGRDAVVLTAIRADPPGA